MPDFHFSQDGTTTRVFNAAKMLVIKHEYASPDVEVEADAVTLTFAELDALAVAWLRWRADHAPADIERLLAAAERTQEGGE